MARLHARGISCQAYFPPIHRQPYFREIMLSRPSSLPQTDVAAERCLALPFFPTMTSEQIGEVSEALRELLSEEPALKETDQKYFSTSAASGL